MSGLRLSKQGYTVLAQVSLKYPYLGPVVSAQFLRENPAAAEAFIKAFVEGIARFKRNREEGIKALARYMKSNETDVLIKPTTSSPMSSTQRIWSPSPKASRNSSTRSAPASRWRKMPLSPRSSI